MKRIFLIFIKIYQKTISPFLHFLFGPQYGCRFSPSCSEYCRASFEAHPFLRAAGLSITRILNCHPWSKRQYFDVPPIK